MLRQSSTRHLAQSGPSPRQAASAAQAGAAARPTPDRAARVRRFDRHRPTARSGLLAVSPGKRGLNKRCVISPNGLKGIAP